MVKSNRAGAARSARRAEGREPTPAEKLRFRADALYRAACECSHQHERAARLAFETAVGGERKLAEQMCGMANQALGEMASAYERASARYATTAHEPWWRKANILWLAAREYQLHHQDCDRATNDLSQPDAGLLGELQVEYELAASALLAMRQAADAYRRARESAAALPQ
jgi:hypothetical protein